MPLKLGRRAPKNAPALRLGPLLTGVVPAHPASEDYLAALHGGWAMLGNDQYGDCVAVTWANVRRLVTTTLTPHGYYPPWSQVEAVYKTQNPGFPGQDDGMDIQTLLEYLVKTGGPDGVKAVAFAQVDHANVDEVKAALAIFGYLWTGINVLDSNMDEFNDGQPWDYDPASSTDGGHSVVTGGYGLPGSGALGGDERFITWAQETSFTDAYWSREVEECWVVVWPEHLGSEAFVTGVNVAQLAADYQEITGRVLPVPVPPQPAPQPPAPPAPPQPDPLLQQLAALIREVAQAEQKGLQEITQWLSSHGLLGGSREDQPWPVLQVHHRGDRARPGVCHAALRRELVGRDSSRRRGSARGVCGPESASGRPGKRPAARPHVAQEESSVTTENRVLALQLAMQAVVPEAGGLPPFQASDVTYVATTFYQWLEGPAFLLLTVDPTTFDQAAPEGPGQPTVKRGSTVQLNDLQQVTLSVAEVDSKNQPVSDQLVWSVDNGDVISLVPSADTQSCLCVAGVDGTATVTVTDNSVNPPLTASDAFVVVSSAATALVISEGTPEDQPPAPPAGP